MTASLSLDEFSAAAGALQRNSDRERLAEQLLDELHRAQTADEATAISNALMGAWLFHEDASITSIVRSGLGSLRAGDLPAAETLFRLATDMDASYAEAWNKLATVQYLAGNDTDALASVRMALALEPRHFGALAGKGAVLVRLGRFSEASRAFGAAVAASPSAVNSWSLRFAGAGTKLIAVVQAQMEGWPSHAMASVLAVALTIGAGSGLNLVRQDVGGLLPQGWTMRAQTQVEMTQPAAGEFKRTIRFERLTRVGVPLEELSREVQGMESNTDKGKLSQRLLDELAAAEDPGRAAGVARLVWSTWLYHENSAAASLIREGSAALAVGDFSTAEWRFHNAAHFDPCFAEAWNKLATLHYMTGQYGVSLSEIDRTLALEPRHFGALSGRGLVLLQLERFEEAADAFREAQEVYPASPGAEDDIAFAEAMARSRAESPATERAESSTAS